MLSSEFKFIEFEFLTATWFTISFMLSELALISPYALYLLYSSFHLPSWDF